jgi:redox-sensitive bicupin YhaK (pirin superfamily)
MSPSDLGELIKPFVFLDLAVFEEGPRTPMEDLWHPHSGIATVTVMLEGGVRIAETTGKQGLLPKGSIEFMRAGNGVWHTGEAAPGHVKAFQLWVALPPELENGPNASHHVMPDDVPAEGPVRVILGEYRDMKSPILQHSAEVTR